jgi:hypothetical protein
MTLGEPAEQSKVLDPETREFYRDVLVQLKDAQVPFMLGGAYAFTHYAGIERHTKDLDVFVLRGHLDASLRALERKGYDTEITSALWLAKAHSGEAFADIIFSSGNGVAPVDEEWLQHAEEGEVFGLSVKMCPVEEMIWQKAFIMERERYDGADVAHLILARGEKLNWARLLHRFDAYWPVLLSHLILFEFIYPGQEQAAPRQVVNELLERFQNGEHQNVPTEHLCRGTLISRSQYLVDIEQWGHTDARLTPYGAVEPDKVF